MGRLGRKKNAKLHQLITTFCPRILLQTVVEDDRNVVIYDLGRLHLCGYTHVNRMNVSELCCVKPNI